MSGRLIANTIYEENVERFGKLQTKVEPVAQNPKPCFFRGGRTLQ